MTPNKGTEQTGFNAPNMEQLSSGQGIRLKLDPVTPIQHSGHHQALRVVLDVSALLGLPFRGVGFLFFRRFFGVFGLLLLIVVVFPFFLGVSSGGTCSSSDMAFLALAVRVALLRPMVLAVTKQVFGLLCPSSLSAEWVL